MVVKGSKQYRSVVVPYRPLWRMGWITALTVAVCLLMMGSFGYGYREAQQDYRLAMEEWNGLHQLASQQAEQLQQLNQQVTNTQVDAQVDKGTLGELRQEISQLNEQIATLQESNQFYRQLMEPETAAKGLNISSWQLTALNESHHFHFELVIQHLNAEHRATTGKINVIVVGSLGGVSKSYSLHELSTSVSKAEIPLKLRFYQTISGDLALPEGFQPLRVDVTVEKTGGTLVTSSFDWAVKK